MEDWRDTDTDLPHNLLVWEDGLPAAYIRLTGYEYLIAHGGLIPGSNLIR